MAGEDEVAMGMVDVQTMASGLTSQVLLLLLHGSNDMVVSFVFRNVLVAGMFS